MPPKITNIRPMLAVVDLPRTIAFYRDKLGFSCKGMFGNPPVWCELERDGQTIMFNAPPRDCVERDLPRKAKDYQIFYINTDNITALYAEFQSRGLAVSALRVMPYHMKEFDLRDPDGYWLMFGQETDEPPTVREG